MKIRTAALLLCLPGVGAAGPAQAQEPLRTSIAACAELRDEALRIECYDALADIAADDPDPPAEPPPGNARTYPVDGRATTAPAPPPPVEPQAGAPANEDLYGLEGRATEDIANIQSRHVGMFEGWSGDTVFPLENGQVWRQSQPGRVSWRADSPMVTIERGWFGSFRLRVEGLNSSVRVERIE